MPGIFKSEIKKEALKLYEASVSKYDAACRALQVEIKGLDDIRKASVVLLLQITDVINTITNTPKEFTTQLQQVDASVAAIKPVEELKQMAFDGYLGAAGELLKGIGVGLIEVGSSTFHNPFRWFEVAAHTVKSVATLTETNCRVAVEARKRTKEVKTQITRLQKRKDAIHALTVETTAIYKSMMNNMAAVNRFKYCNYLSLSADDKLFLGEVVNHAYSLSQLLIGDTAFEEIPNE